MVTLPKGSVFESQNSTVISSNHLKFKVHCTKKNVQFVYSVINHNGVD